MQVSDSKEGELHDTDETVAMVLLTHMRPQGHEAPVTPQSLAVVEQIENIHNMPQPSMDSLSSVDEAAAAPPRPIPEPSQPDHLMQHGTLTARPAAQSAAKPSSSGGTANVTVPNVPSRLLVGTVSSSFKSGSRITLKSGKGTSAAVPQMEAGNS